nr:hypothetical protein [Pseudomonas coronafaciens]
MGHRAGHRCQRYNYRRRSQRTDPRPGGQRHCEWRRGGRYSGRRGRSRQTYWRCRCRYLSL